MRWYAGTVLLGALLGCGAESDGPPSAPEPAPDPFEPEPADPEVPPEPSAPEQPQSDVPLCSGRDLDLDTVLLASVFGPGPELAFVRANGESERVVARRPTSEVAVRARHGDGIVLGWQNHNTTEPRSWEIGVYDIGGERMWAAFEVAENFEWDRFDVLPDGSISIGGYLSAGVLEPVIRSEGLGVLVRPDGEVVALPAVITDPDPDGWAVGLLRPTVDEYVPVLVNVSSEEVRPATYPLGDLRGPGRPGAWQPLAGPRFAYVTLVDETPTLVDESLDGARTFPLSPVPRDASIGSLDVTTAPGSLYISAAFARADGFPVALPLYHYDTESRELTRLAPENDVPDGAIERIASRELANSPIPGLRLFLSEDESVVWLLDLSNGRLTDLSALGPLGIELELSAGDGWGLIVGDGIPRWIVDRTSGELSPAEAELEASSAQTLLAGDFAVVMADGLPRYRLDLRARASRPIVASGLEAAEGDGARFSTAGKWVAAFIGPRPLFRVDAESGEAEPYSLDTPLESFAAERFAQISEQPTYCYPNVTDQPDAVLHADGTVAALLRNDEQAQLFRAAPDSDRWEPLGLPFREVEFATFSHPGPLFLLDAGRGCSSALVSWSEASTDSTALRGPSTQLIDDAGRRLPLSPSSVTLDSSGTCALVSTAESQLVYDLAAGRVTTLGLTDVIGWWN